MRASLRWSVESYVRVPRLNGQKRGMESVGAARGETAGATTTRCPHHGTAVMGWSDERRDRGTYLSMYGPGARSLRGPCNHSNTLTVRVFARLFRACFRRACTPTRTGTYRLPPSFPLPLQWHAGPSLRDIRSTEKERKRYTSPLALTYGSSLPSIRGRQTRECTRWS